MSDSEQRFDDAWHDWPFDPLGALRALAAHDVEFILIGGLAAVLHGSPLPTFDIDITVRRTPANADALQRALADMDARQVTPAKVGAGSGTAADTGRQASYLTRFGYLDVIDEPAALRDYRVLARRAEWVEIEPGLRVRVASVQDIVASKQALGRTRDTAQLPALLALLDVC